MERTKVVLAQSESKSLRTTIPAGIARQFDIKEGSELGWDIQARDNKLVIVVAPIIDTAVSGGYMRPSSPPPSPTKKGKAGKD